MNTRRPISPYLQELAQELAARDWSKDDDAALLAWFRRVYYAAARYEAFGPVLDILTEQIHCRAQAGGMVVPNHSPAPLYVSRRYPEWLEMWPFNLLSEQFRRSGGGVIRED